MHTGAATIGRHSSSSSLHAFAVLVVMIPTGLWLFGRVGLVAFSPRTDRRMRPHADRRPSADPGRASPAGGFRPCWNAFRQPLFQSQPRAPRLGPDHDGSCRIRLQARQWISGSGRRPFTGGHRRPHRRDSALPPALRGIPALLAVLRRSAARRARTAQCLLDGMGRGDHDRRQDARKRLSRRTSPWRPATHVGTSRFT